MPRPNEFVTSANQNYSLYITREEVIQGISSIIPALSSFSTISFGVSPNPTFSTIRMNSGGSISGYVPIQTNNLVFQSTTTLGQSGNLVLGKVGSQNNQALCVTDNNGVMATMRAQNFIANASQASGFSAGWAFSSNGFVTVDGNGVGTPIITWQFGNNQKIAMSNISTINGVPVGQQFTTYTSISGSNINNSGVITAPSIVSLSSLNGVPLSSYANSQLWVPYTVTNTNLSNVTMVANTPQVIFTFNNIPITAGVGKYVNISVPINVSAGTQPIAAQTNVQLIAYLGGNVSLNTGVSGNCLLTPASGSGPNSVRQVTLTGVAAVNGPTATLQIQAVCDQSIVLSFQQASYYAKFFFQQVV